ncbi:universal stress protein [Natronolimnohabitans innermongolicus]|uniref:UspA domain-containing protein n=1 Tax=Natronolimnohabitans innermongolicus JCM 12255 TaxID=1227499 RepID=L9X2A9_9EURY|nr:universal stress protein [Natronolimnohabitans innermongolicus]ELY55860.1 UspA domain-containing protein [Natronolimnohabitans innermongolicus JCM 12255]
MTVLVAYDGSEPAQKAIKRAFDEYGDEEIVLLRVVEFAGGYTGAGIKAVQDLLNDERESAAANLREDLSELVDTTDVDFRTEVAAGAPAREIVSFAEEHDIDHIIVGSHGRKGVSRVLLGSVAEQVVRRSPVSVTVVR